MISIHVPRVEDDPRVGAEKQLSLLYINPRPPCGGRRIVKVSFRVCWYFNPRPPCGGRQDGFQGKFRQPYISIHVPRVEDDEDDEK